MFIHRSHPAASPMYRLALLALLAAATVIPLVASPDTARAQRLGGELQCAPMDKVDYVWMRGSSSGWHGYDFPTPPYTGAYSMTNAVRGETMEVWMGCVTLGEYYTSFRVGSGSVRHICSTSNWGLISLCTSKNVGGCALQAAFTGLNVRVVACFVRNL